MAKSNRRVGCDPPSEACEMLVGCGPKGEGFVAVEGCPNDANGFVAGFAFVKDSLAAVEGWPNVNGLAVAVAAPWLPAGCAVEANDPDGFAGAAENDHGCEAVTTGFEASEVLANGEVVSALLSPKEVGCANRLPLTG